MIGQQILFIDINLKSFFIDAKKHNFFPIFENKSDTNYFRFEYVEKYGEKIDVSKELRSTIERENTFIGITQYTYEISNATQHGWTDGINNFFLSDYLIMPRRNVTLYVIFQNFRKL